MQHFFDEHSAKRQRQLINQTADTQFFIVDDIFVCFKDFANFQSHFCFFVRTGYVFQITYNSTAGNVNFAVCFCVQCFFDNFCNAVDFVCRFFVTEFFYQNDAVFIHCCHKVFCFRGENASDDFHNIHFFVDVCFDQIYDSAYIVFNVQFFRAAVNIYQQQVIQQQVFDKVVFVVSFFISHQQTLNLEGSNLTDTVAFFVFAFYLYHIFGYTVIINLEILITQNQLTFSLRAHKIFHRINLASNHVFFRGSNDLAFLFHDAQFFSRNVFQSINGTL